MRRRYQLSKIGKEKRKSGMCRLFRVAALAAERLLPPSIPSTHYLPSLRIATCAAKARKKGSHRWGSNPWEASSRSVSAP
jgi:hypothetical protein